MEMIYGESEKKNKPLFMTEDRESFCTLNISDAVEEEYFQRWHKSREKTNKRKWIIDLGNLSVNHSNFNTLIYYLIHKVKY